MLVAAEEPPAIRKLGWLFKLTEVHIWDDSCGAGANVSHKHRSSAETGFTGSQIDKTCNKPGIQTDEDLELANLMGSMGLPVSFSTSKEKKNTAKKGKKKGRQALCEAANTPMDDIRTCANTEEIEIVVALMACVEHINSCSSSRTDVAYNEAFHDDIEKMLGEDYVDDQEVSGCSAEIVPGDEAENQCELEPCWFHDNMSNPVKSDSPVRENQAVDSALQLTKEMLGQNSVNSESRISCTEICQEGRLSSRDDQISGETPSISHDNNDVDREACASGWAGTRFYNESRNLSELPGEEPTNRSMITAIDEAQHAASIQNGSLLIEVLEMNQDVASTKKKKRARRSQLYHSCQDSAGNISNDITKYWIQRYSLFSLYDSGIKMDKEGWFSVTPEPIAKHQASRVGGGVVIDCFTGVGGNAIQFATKCKHVIAVDIDPQKIDCAQHNATVYGVNGHIDFIVGDFIHIAPHLKGETIFMSPPWGGPDYAKVDVYDIKAMLKPCDGYSLFKLATAMASRVVMFLPRNVDLNQLADMCLSVDPPWAVEVEKNFLNGKLKAITAYFEEQDGSDVHHIGDTDHKNYVQ